MAFERRKGRERDRKRGEMYLDDENSKGRRQREIMRRRRDER